MSLSPIPLSLLSHSPFSNPAVLLNVFLCPYIILGVLLDNIRADTYTKAITHNSAACDLCLSFHYLSPFSLSIISLHYLSPFSLSILFPLSVSLILSPFLFPFSLCLSLCLSAVSLNVFLCPYLSHIRSND
jgi:hypothetical protein